VRRVVLALLVTAGAWAPAGAPAQAGIIAPEDAAELAQTLAEAEEEQGICYGWNVTNNFDSSPDVGSSNGPGAPLLNISGACRGVITLTGSISYACGSCEASDSASISIDSSFPNGPTADDLEDLGLKAGDLTGDNDDTTLINMVNALPLLAADRGLGPYIAYEAATNVPPTDRATNKPGSDLLRDRWLLLVFCGVLAVSGPGFYLYKRQQERSRQRPQEPQEKEGD
jgi:hypothetical protein